MKKNKIKLLKILGSASLISMPFLLVQCINQRTNDTNQRIDELKKILQDYETTLIDKPLYENINEIIKKDISFFSVNNNFLYLDNLLKIAKKVLTKKVYKNSIPNKIIKFNEKLNVIYEVWTSIINKNKLIDDIELKDFEQLFIKTREDLTIKKVYNEQEFDEIIKKFVIVAKKIRNYYNKKISQHAIEFNTLFTKEFPTLIIKNNLIQNNDLDSIFNIEPKKDNEENNDPKPDGNTSENEEDAGSNNKDKEIYLDKNSIFVNKKEYLISNFFEEEKAVEVSINEISDGDTAKFISTRSSEQYKVRFSGIDTPETWRKNSNGQFVPTEGKQYKYGQIAKKFTTSNLENAKKIWVIPQTTKSEKNVENNKFFFDHYGRVVGIILVMKKDGNIICINKELVKNGHSKVAFISLQKNSKYYTKNENYYTWIKNFEKEARQKQIGIWSEDIKEIYPPKNRR